MVKTIDEEALLKEVEKELKNVKELSETDEKAFEAEAMKHLASPKASYKLKRPVDPLTKERQQEREVFKRKLLVGARAKFEELGLTVNEAGEVVKKSGGEKA